MRTVLRHRCFRHLLIILVFLPIACVSTVVVEDDASKTKIIHLAQSEFNSRNYNKALQYYEVLLERFGDDPVVHLTTSYEIAYIHYTTKDYATARAGFLEIQSRYEDAENSDAYPLWPMILTTKLLDSLEADTLEKNGQP